MSTGDLTAAAARGAVRGANAPASSGAAVRFTVAGTPVPKGSRTLGRRRDGSPFSRPAAAGEHAWVEAVARTARWRRAQAVELPAAGELPAAPYAVEMMFSMPRPARLAHAWPTRGDVDKLVRAVLDGLVRGGLLTDDRHVVELRATKAWATALGGEGVFVTVTGATPPPAVAEPASARSHGAGSGP